MLLRSRSFSTLAPMVFDRQRPNGILYNCQHYLLVIMLYQGFITVEIAIVVMKITRAKHDMLVTAEHSLTLVERTFVTSTTFVTAHQFCQFISTIFVYLTSCVNFSQLRGHQFCKIYQPLMSLQTRSQLLLARPDHFCQP